MAHVAESGKVALTDQQQNWHILSEYAKDHDMWKEAAQLEDPVIEFLGKWGCVYGVNYIFTGEVCPDYG